MGSRTERGDYLLEAAAARADLLLMDRKNVLVGGGIQMEVCDLAHVDGAMVHVKKRDTKGLSHLAAQVLGSATRWSRERGYRDAVLEKMQHQAAETQKDGDAFCLAFEPSVARQPASEVEHVAEQMWPDGFRLVRGAC